MKKLNGFGVAGFLVLVSSAQAKIVDREYLNSSFQVNKQESGLIVAKKSAPLSILATPNKDCCNGSACCSGDESCC